LNPKKDVSTPPPKKQEDKVSTPVKEESKIDIAAIKASTINEPLKSVEDAKNLFNKQPTASVPTKPAAVVNTDIGDEKDNESPSGTIFSYSDLIKKPAPEGTDPSKKETYLSYAEFKKMFGMTYEEYNKIPQKWKKDDLKKKLNLF
jgi:stage V sporulation protein SpoVS